MYRRRNSSVLPTIPGTDAEEARKRFEAASHILDGAHGVLKTLPSQESLKRARAVREQSTRLIDLLEKGITPESAADIDAASTAVVQECLGIRQLTLQARKKAT